MWHSWPRGAGPMLPQDTCIQMQAFSHPVEETASVQDLDTSRQCAHTMLTCWGPQVCPPDHLSDHQTSFPSEEVLSHAVCLFLLHSLPPLSGAARPWVSPASPSQKLTFPSFHLQFTTYNFLGSSSRIPLKCYVFILSPFGKNRSWAKSFPCVSSSTSLNNTGRSVLCFREAQRG